MERAPTIRDILAKAEGYLAGKGVDSPRLSAQLLLAKALGLDRMALFLAMDRPLTSAELDAFRPLVARRGKGEPAAYILGEREFYGLAFAVTPDVLIPRPETEHIVERALALFPKDAPLVFADLGTGSGCLAVTLAVKFQNARGLALDASETALAVARQNAAAHGVADRITFVHGDFSDLPPGPPLDLIVCNPPYVSGPEYAALSREVAGFEPKAALTPGETGLEAMETVGRIATSALAPGGRLLVEIGCTQGPAVRDIFSGLGLADVAVHRDLAGLDRVVEARRPLP